MRLSRKAGHRGGDREHVNNCLEGHLAAPLASKRTCLPPQCQAAPARSPALTCAHLPTDRLGSFLEALELGSTHAVWGAGPERGWGLHAVTLNASRNALSGCAWAKMLGGTQPPQRDRPLRDGCWKRRHSAHSAACRPVAHLSWSRWGVGPGAELAGAGEVFWALGPLGCGRAVSCLPHILEVAVEQDTWVL